MIEQRTQTTSLDATIALWRKAAEVVATDPSDSRRQAYQEVIAVVRRHLQASVTIGAIMTVFGRGELHTIAIRDALCRHGKTLNADVIVAAACWQHLAALLAQQSDAGVA